MSLCAEAECTCDVCEEVRAKKKVGGYMKLKSRGAKLHPPIHKGCDCYIVPETVTREAEVPIWKDWTTVGDAERALRTKLGVEHIDDVGYATEKKLLDDLNYVGRELGELAKNTRIRVYMAGNKKLKGFTLVNKDLLPDLEGRSRGSLGQYWFEKQYRQIDVAFGKNPRSASLHIGGNFWSVGDDVGSTIRHEFGHHVLTVEPGLEGDWIDDVFKGRGGFFFGEEVSQYAGEVSVGESFAESFSAYTSPLYKKGMLPEVIEDFFEKRGF